MQSDFKFSSVSAENLLVPLPARPSGSVPTMHFFMMRLIGNVMWEVLVSNLLIFYIREEQYTMDAIYESELTFCASCTKLDIRKMI